MCHSEMLIWNVRTARPHCCFNLCLCNLQLKSCQIKIILLIILLILMARQFQQFLNYLTSSITWFVKWPHGKDLKPSSRTWLRIDFWPYVRTDASKQWTILLPICYWVRLQIHTRLFSASRIRFTWVVIKLCALTAGLSNKRLSQAPSRKRGPKTQKRRGKLK